MTNQQARDTIRLTTDHRENQCVDLRGTFAGRYRFEWDEAYHEERPERRSTEASWLTMTPCKFGKIFPWGDRTLAAYSNAGGVKRRELEALACVEVVQGGGQCQEVVVTFDVSDFDLVAEVLKARRPRQYSPEERARRTARLAKARSVRKRPKLPQDYRMVLMSASALGALRRELIETLGWDQARSLLKRFGHAAGLADGLALAERFPSASRREHLEFGPALHGLEGVARVVRIPEKTHLDPDQGHCHFEAFLENSYEAEQHLELFGKSEEPVCWTFVGYATGHSSIAAGNRTIAYETECLAMGHSRCRLVAG